jgi:hypothetical protein
MALRSLRVHVAARRFELSLAHREPLVLAVPIAAVLAVVFGARLGLAIGGPLVFAAATHRRALVVTPTTSWVADRVLGARYRVRWCGRAPRVASLWIDELYDHTELAITPTQLHLAARLDGGRIALGWWWWTDRAFDRHLELVVGVAREQIARLQER